MLIDSLALSPTPPSPRAPWLPPAEIGRRAAALPLCLKRPEKNYVSSNIAAAVQWGRHELNRNLLQSPPVVDMYAHAPYCSLRKAALHPCPPRTRTQLFRSSVSPSSHLTSSTFDGHQNADAVRAHARIQHALNNLVDDVPPEGRTISNELLLSLHSSISGSGISLRDSTVKSTAKESVTVRSEG